MIQLSSDTPLTGWDCCSAYHYSDKKNLWFFAHAFEWNGENVYIQSTKLNRENYNKSYLLFDAIKKGGSIDFEMDKTQNTKWIVELRMCR